MEDTEIWLPVVGHEGLYEVSPEGKVKSVTRLVGRGAGKGILEGQMMLPRVSIHGYMRVGLVKNGKQKSYFLHRLVAMAYLENPENKIQVNHKDGNKLNNTVENLEWSTRCENMQHAIKNKLRLPFPFVPKERQARGARIKKSKQIVQLTLANEFIREWECITDAAKHLNKCRRAIAKRAQMQSNILHGYRWMLKCRYEKELLIKI